MKTLKDQAFVTAQKILEYLDEKAELAVEMVGDDVWINISGGDSGRLIGKGGRGLDALQTVISRIVQKNYVERVMINVDIDGYKKKREGELIKMAEEASGKVEASGRSLALEPMNGWERKIIHLALKDDDRVETESEDTEDGRRVRIRLRTGSESPESDEPMISE
jgi:spoIIIJ-associated protein